MHCECECLGGVLQLGCLVSSRGFECEVWREAGILDLGVVGTQVVTESWK